MKKSVSMLLAVSMTLVLAGCAGTAAETTARSSLVHRFRASSPKALTNTRRARMDTSARQASSTPLWTAAFPVQ